MDTAWNEASSKAHRHGCSGDNGTDFSELEPSLRAQRGHPSGLIELLNRAQELYGHLSEPLLRHLAEELALPLSRVFGTASFYHLFRFQPPSPHQLVVCTGTACHVKGADRLLSVLDSDREAGVEVGRVRCLGTCGGAPLVVVNGTVWRHQSEASLREGLRRLKR